MDSENLFSPVGPLLDQGDLVDFVPWGLVDAPLALAFVDGGKPQGKGRIEHRPKFEGPKNLLARANQGLGIVLWHGCQIDKGKHSGKNSAKLNVGVAPVVPLTGAADYLSAVREGRKLDVFHLPTFDVDGRVFPESLIDLRHIWTIRQSLLLSEGQRVARLGAELRGAMFYTLFRFFTRLELPDEVTCPSCSTKAPLKEFLGVAEHQEN